MSEMTLNHMNNLIEISVCIIAKLFLFPFWTPQGYHRQPGGHPHMRNAAVTATNKCNSIINFLSFLLQLYDLSNCWGIWYVWCLRFRDHFCKYFFEFSATTLWELWDSPSEGPGMNSRNHSLCQHIKHNTHASRHTTTHTTQASPETGCRQRQNVTVTCQHTLTLCFLCAVMFGSVGSWFYSTLAGIKQVCKNHIKLPRKFHGSFKEW